MENRSMKSIVFFFLMLSGLANAMGTDQDKFSYQCRKCKIKISYFHRYQVEQAAKNHHAREHNKTVNPKKLAIKNPIRPKLIPFYGKNYLLRFA